VETLITTTVIGSYPQPGWLVERERLVGAGVPRVRAAELWKVEPEHRADAFEAAALVAIADQEAAGVDVITDGEMGRESYFNHFATALGGIDPERTGLRTNRLGTRSRVPVVTGPIERTAAIEVEAARFLRSHTKRATKVTVPGPFTLSELAQNEHYPDQRQLALAYAAAIRQELADLAEVGIDVLQLDEPYLQSNPAAARHFAAEAVGAAVGGITATTVVHTCFGYAQYVGDKSGGYPFFDELAALPVDFVAVETAQPGLDPSVVARLRPRSVVLGVLDLGTEEIERPDDIAATIRAALEHLSPAELAVSPDCGMKFLPRPVARAKLAAMVEGAAIARAELA
jgi:5-methyltetrahydropteroyltriglutamate--homocysteine methyltransferase